MENDYYLRIIYDYNNPNHTLIYVNNNLMNNIFKAEARFSLDDEKDYCNIKFTPKQILIKTPIQSLIDKMKNKVEILSNGESYNTIIKLNGKPIPHIHTVYFSYSQSKGPKISIKQDINGEEILDIEEFISFKK
jgi:hypothetical protein